MAPREKVFEISESGFKQHLRISRLGVGPLNTAIARLHLFAFHVADRWQKYSVLVKGTLSRSFDLILDDACDELLLRVDSGCETGQMFHERTCECRQQLDKCIEMISRVPVGMIINIPTQDGRGMGLPFKLATLRLQDDLGVDTVESSAMLEPDSSRDIRTYAGAIGILKFFNLESGRVKLAIASNNPHKLPIFAENGYVTRTEPIIIEPTEFTRRHLEAKQRELGHTLGL